MLRRRSPGIFGSIVGVLIGLVLVVLVSPLLAWSSQTQHRAKDFKSAEVVSAESVTPGYIVVEGDAEQVDEFYCPMEGDLTVAVDEFSAEGRDRCVYAHATEETYQYVEKEVCGDIQDDQEIIEHTEDDCFLVKELEWVQTDQNEAIGTFKIGAYTVIAEDAILIDDESFTQYPDGVTDEVANDGDVRYTYDFLEFRDRMLVAGSSESAGAIEGAFDKKTFVVSQKGYDGTLDALKMMDRGAATMLAIVSLLAMMFGMILIVGPLSILTNIFVGIPFIGTHVTRGFDLVVKAFAALVGFVIWIPMFVIVVIINKLLIAIIVLAVLGAIALYLAQKGKIKLKKEHKTTVQEEKPSEKKEL